MSETLNELKKYVAWSENPDTDRWFLLDEENGGVTLMEADGPDWVEVNVNFIKAIANELALIASLREQLADKEREVRNWYVTNHGRDDMPLRGPFKYPETAGAVRAEMEQQSKYDHINLGVFQLSPSAEEGEK